MDTSFMTAKTHSKGKWISSSFAEPQDQKNSLNKVITSTFDKSALSVTNRKLSVAKNAISWLEKYSPRKKVDLAVHKKKVDQVEEWLISALGESRNYGRKTAPILLLTGPPGCGKSATVRVLSNELNFDIQEWDNLQRFSLMSTSNRGDQEGCEFLKGERQADSFRDFMIRAGKYHSLMKPGLKKAILVEDFPNVFVKDASQFHQILRKFSHCGYAPAIFIISEKGKGEVSEKHLFPKDLQEDLRITHISFNAIASGAMGKALNSLILKENQRHGALDKVNLNQLVETTDGDIRSAINFLQFSCLPDTRKQMKPQSKKVQKHGGNLKDTALVLFHALGKVLYCKRLNDGNEPDLPPHLSKFKRKLLVENPEDIFDKTAVSSDGFTLFLHHNYPEFLSTVAAASEVTEYFSQADSIGSHWTESHDLSAYAVSLVVRGLMFQLNTGDSNSAKKWKSLCKPDWYARHRKTQENMMSLSDAFPEWRLNCGEEVQTVLLPYMAHMKYYGDQLVRKNLISSLTTFSSRFFGSQSALLEEEAEIDVHELRYTSRKSPTSHESSLLALNEEEVVIEEFED